MNKKLESLNKEIEKCTKCRLKKSRINALPGEGNLNSRLILIAQAPGENENKNGKMFVGPTGKVLDDLFKEINLNRNEIYMTNLIKCMLPNYRAPKQDEIDTCSKYLEKEIEIINPDTIASLGYYSTRYIFEKYNLSDPKDRNDFQELCGRILLTPERKILPLLHPTTLLFIKKVKDRMIEDYRKIKTLLKDCKWYPSCPMKRLYEKGVLDRKWIELYCKGDWLSCVRYSLEERGESHPDFMLPDGSIDERLSNY